MKKSDRDVLKRLLRRVTHPRGTVFVEFAVTAPLAVMLMCFAFDFTRVLRVEQQLEIGARALADLESHLAKKSYDGMAVPHDLTYPSLRNKRLIRNYVMSTVRGLDEDSVYCKAKCKDIPGVSTVLNSIGDFLTGDPGNVPAAISVISSVLGKIFDVVTLKTHRYLTEIAPRDKMLSASCGAYLPTLMPRGVYNVMGLPIGSGKKRDFESDRACIVQARQKIRKDASPGKSAFIADERERAWCVMPMMDSAVQPPLTYTRQIKGIFKKYIPKWLQVLLF